MSNFLSKKSLFVEFRWKLTVLQPFLCFGMRQVFSTPKKIAFANAFIHRDLTKFYIFVKSLLSTLSLTAIWRKSEFTKKLLILVKFWISQVNFWAISFLTRPYLLNFDENWLFCSHFHVLKSGKVFRRRKRSLSLIASWRKSIFSSNPVR